MRPIFSTFFNALADRSHPAEGQLSFGDHAGQWWESDGPMAPLHRINPIRMSYVKSVLCRHFGRDEAAPQALRGLTILDIGCGGGLVTESLVRLGATVTGIDASKELIVVAKDHAAQQGLQVTYEDVLSEALVARGKKFDAVLALEVIEHVDAPEDLLGDIKRLLKTDGIAILSTLNRTAASFAGGIVAAEYILQWVPRGTHDWRAFLKPSELSALGTAVNLTPTETMGLHYRPLTKQFVLHPERLEINYFMVFTHAA